MEAVFDEWGCSSHSHIYSEMYHNEGRCRVCHIWKVSKDLFIKLISWDNLRTSFDVSIDSHFLQCEMEKVNLEKISKLVLKWCLWCVELLLWLWFYINLEFFWRRILTRRGDKVKQSTSLSWRAYTGPFSSVTRHLYPACFLFSNHCWATGHLRQASVFVLRNGDGRGKHFGLLKWYYLNCLSSQRVFCRVALLSISLVLSQHDICTALYAAWHRTRWI